MIRAHFVKLHPDAVVPTKANKDDFAYDITAVSCEEIAPDVWKYHTGLAIQLNAGGFVDVVPSISLRPRSSVWKTGMVLSNSVGTIDFGYTGEICAVFYHVMKDMPKYEPGDRIGQIFLSEAERLRFVKVETLEETERGAGGYGSTGR